MRNRHKSAQTSDSPTAQSITILELCEDFRCEFARVLLASDVPYFVLSSNHQPSPHKHAGFARCRLFLGSHIRCELYLKQYLAPENWNLATAHTTDSFLMSRHIALFALRCRRLGRNASIRIHEFNGTLPRPYPVGSGVHVLLSTRTSRRS